MKKKGIIFLKYLSILICIFSFGVAFSSYNQTLTIFGKSNVTGSLPKSDLVFTNTTNITNQGSKRNISISFSVTNNGNAPSYSWEFELSIPSDASSLNCWGTICTQQGTSLNLSNEGWNGIILPGESSTGGITFQTRNPDYVPEDPVIVDPDNTNLAALVLVDVIQTGTWGNGNNRVYQYDVTITNNNTVGISWWRFDLKKDVFDFTVNSLWNGIYVDSTTEVRVSNVTWNGAISAGGSTSIGMQLKNKRANFTISASDVRAGN